MIPTDASIRIRFTLEDESPVLDLAPDHSRMASCCRDQAGVYHLFTDVIAAGLQTVHSWEAEIRHFRSRDLKTWEAVADMTFIRGQQGAPDSFGVASPHMLSVPEKGRVYLFYAGRGHPRPGEAWNGRALPGEPGYVSSHIMMASAEADADGAPVGPFGERRLIVGLDAAWRNMRVDDPCAIVVDGHVHLYFKGFGVPGPFHDGRHELLKCGYAVADLDDMRFSVCSSPLPGLDGGEMPRVFTLGDQWHLLYRCFAPAPGETHWQYYISQDGIEWRLNQSRLFTRPHCPRNALPYDMAPVYGVNGELAEPPAALACGQDQADGCLKQWLYRLETDFFENGQNII